MALQKPNRIYTDIDIAFTAHPATGDVSVRSDVNAVMQSLKNLLMTNFYERLFQPQIGSPLNRLLFEPIDPITTHTIKQSIERLIFNWEPRVNLIELEVIPQYDENAYEINITFSVVGIGAPVTFSTILKRTR